MERKTSIYETDGENPLREGLAIINMELENLLIFS
jgi:hypothetical protein